MRIISDFHDYYDSVQAQGQDQTNVYIRKQKEELIEPWPFPMCKAVSWSWSRERLKCRESIIGFCGKIYPVLELGVGGKKDDITALCWSLDDVDAFVEAHYSKKEITGYRQTKGYNRQWDHSDRRMHFQEFFEKCEAKKEEFLEMFREERSPIFLAELKRTGWIPRVGWKRDSKITWNAELKPRKFYKVFDVYMAFQEIASFMSNLAIPLNPIPDIDDKTMAGAKGFDKFSFRKDPTKR